MLTETALEIEVARRTRISAELRVPDDARGTVAIVGESEPLVAACNGSGFATLTLELSADAHEVDRLAALFSDAVAAVTDDRSLRDRPVGFYGAGVAGAAVLIAAALRSNDVAAVVTLDAPLELVGMHLSGVKAPTLLMIDPVNELLVERTRAVLPPLPNTSAELQLDADAGNAVQWFDRYLRGVMRSMRRELWRSA